MTKEEKRAYNKEYRAKNKEKVSQINKEWRDNNKEKIAEYRANNKEYYKEYNKKYGKEYYLKNIKKRKEYIIKNKERIKDYDKERNINRKDGYHRVYLLEDYNYVGVTDCTSRRFSEHKSHFNRDCTNHRILYKSKDRKECEELEDLLHDMGYEGRHRIKNKKTVNI